VKLKKGLGKISEKTKLSRTRDKKMLSSEDENEDKNRNEVDSKCISQKIKLKKGIGKQEEKIKTDKSKDESSTAISERPRRNMVPVKYENFDMKQEPLDDYPQENEASDASDDDEDEEDFAEEMEGSAKNKAYCTCKSAYNKNQPMIGCDGPCQDWYHFGCVGIPQNFRSIADWYCENCFYKLTKGDTQICLCDAEFEAAHELVRCKARCGKLYHPGCLGLANADKVQEWEGEGGQCGYCADS